MVFVIYSVIALIIPASSGGGAVTCICTSFSMRIITIKVAKQHMCYLLSENIKNTLLHGAITCRWQVYRAAGICASLAAY